MNAWNQILFIAALAFALTAFGCGDDDTPTDTGIADTGGGDTGGGDTGGDGAVPCEATGMMCPAPGDYTMGMTGNCDNAGDIAAVNREDYGDMSDQDVSDLAGDCGVGCIADPNIVGCTATCVVAATGDEISMECAICYSAAVACGAERCIGVCLAAPDSEECGACISGDNDCCFDCGMEASVCAGFDLSMPPAP